MSKKNTEITYNRLLYKIKNHPKLSALILGALLSVCYAPYFLWPLLAIIYSSLFSFISVSLSPKHAFKIGWWFGVGMYLGCFNWLYIPTYELIALNAGIDNGWPLHGFTLTVMLVFLLSLALPVATMCWLFAYGQSFAPYKARPWVFAFCMVTAEYLRGFPFWPFLPWNLTGYALAGNQSLIQVAAIGGVGLMSWLALGIASSFSSMAHARFAAIVLLLWFSAGLLYIETRSIPANNADYYIRLIQAKTPYEDSFSERGKRKSFLTHLSVSKDPTPHTPNLIIWPEGALRYVLADEPSLIGLLNEFEEEMLFGAFTKEMRPYTTLRQHPNAPHKTVKIKRTEALFYNSVFYKPAGRDVALDKVAQKRMIVPVGEQLPLMAYFKMFYRQHMPHFKPVTAKSDASPYLDTSLGKVLVINCYEALFSRIIWRDAAQADWLLHMTNDAWYQGSVAREQFFYIARIRAVEAGKPLIRVANAGINGMFDAYGRILYRFDPQVLPMPNDMPVSRAMLATAPNLFIQDK